MKFEVLFEVHIRVKEDQADRLLDMLSKRYVVSYFEDYYEGEEGDDGNGLILIEHMSNEDMAALGPIITEYKEKYHEI